MIACEFFDGWTAKEVLTVFSGLLTPLLAIVATYIAYQQWRTNWLKIQHDLFDRRFAVFTALIEFVRKGKDDETATFALLQTKTVSCFLFPKEIPDYIETIYQKAVRLQYCNYQLNTERIPKGEERTRLANEHSELTMWFGNQYEEAKKKFGEHLKLYL